MLKKIPANKLTTGMYLHEVCGSWLKSPFWRKAFLLQDVNDIKAIHDSGVKEVVIDTAKGRDITSEVEVNEQSIETTVHADESALHVNESNKQKKTTAEWRRARAICDSAKEAVVQMFQDVRMGKVVDVEATQPLVDEISASVARCPDTLISLARLKTCDDYTYLHSVAVCAMMIALARELNLTEAQIREAGVGGLMHDMGKATVPLEILNKPGKLSDEEYKAIQNHTVAGYKLLQVGGNLSDEVLDVVLHHHEKFDGSGYPEGLKGEELSVLARMAAICDVYDAVTSNRPYKEGWSPAVSLKRMLSWQGHFDPHILQLFVKIIGIYPVGELVKLESGRLAVVVEQTEGQLLAPIVKVFFSTKPSGPIAIEILDLASPKCKDTIIGIESIDSWGFKNLEDIWALA